MRKRFERMMKCLELTASPNDAEALAAMRAANKIREELGLKWPSIVNVGHVPPSKDDDFSEVDDWPVRTPPADQWYAYEEENERQRKEQAAQQNAAYQKYQREAQLKEEQEAREFAERRKAKEARDREEWRTRFPELLEDEGYS